MDINRILMTVFAVGAFIGGIDFLLGNKFGFGEKFEEAIQLMPPTAFNMVGIICISPLIAAILRLFIAPLCNRVGIDPGLAVFLRWIWVDIPLPWSWQQMHK